MNNDFRTMYLGNWNIQGCMLKDNEGRGCQGSSDVFFIYKGDKVALCGNCYKDLIAGRFKKTKENIGYFYIGRKKIT